MAVGSFSAGLSGLNANAQALAVVGNNLANINTVGYKASTVSFQDLVSQTVGGNSINPAQVGLGVGLGAISPVFSQGTIESSRVATNVAIQGSGFFVLDGVQGRSFTRAGNFSFDSEGSLISPDGQFAACTSSSASRATRGPSATNPARSSTSIIREKSERAPPLPTNALICCSVTAAAGAGRPSSCMRLKTMLRSL